MKYSGEELRDAMVRAAADVWSTCIEDKHGGVNDAITEIFDDCGWGGWLRSDAGGCPDGYTRPPDPDWCGLFVAYCGLRVGRYLEADACVDVSLAPLVARKVLPSTYRLASGRHWTSANTQQPAPVHRTEVAPGDVVTVGASKPWGTHIVLVARVEGDKYETIEGNGRGILPDGRTGRGCVKRTRNVADIRYVYRLDAGHFVEGE